MSRRDRGPLDRVAMPVGPFEKVLENFLAVAGPVYGFDRIWILVAGEGGLTHGGHWGAGAERLPDEVLAYLAGRLMALPLAPGRPLQADAGDPVLGPLVRDVGEGGILLGRLRLHGRQPFMYADLGLSIDQELLLLLGGLPPEGLPPEEVRGLLLLAQQSFNLAYVSTGLIWTGNLSTGLFQLSPYGMVRKNPGPGFVFNRQAAAIAGLDAGGAGSVRRIQDLFPAADRVGLTELIRKVEARETERGELEFRHRVGDEERLIRAKVTYLDIGPDEEEWASLRDQPEGGNYWVILGLEDVTERVGQQRVQRELELAQEVQRGLMPEHLPELEGLRLAARTAPASEMNGDFYDLIARPDGSLVLAVGDVSGHGIAAALVMGMAKSALHTALGVDHEIPVVMQRVNDTLAFLTDRRVFVTLGLARIDPARRELTLSAAGHPPPLHYSAERDRLEFLELVAYPAGIRRSVELPVCRRELGAGDLLLFYSDGIVEALDPQENVFGYERLEEAVRSCLHLPPAGILDALTRTLADFHGDRPRDDDQTLLAVRVR